MAYMIEPIATSLNMDFFVIAGADAKDISQAGRPMAGLQFQSFYLPNRFARKRVRYNRRQVEAMIKSLPKDQCQRPHGSSSCK